jgi:hypothetical protein
MFPQGVVQEGRATAPGTLKIVIARPNDVAADSFKQLFESEIRMIRECVERSTKQVEGFNGQLAGLIRSAVVDRRARLDRHKGIAALLDIPLAQKAGAPSVQPIQVEIRPLPKLPVPPKSGLTAEPGISQDTFEKILSMIRHEGRTFETTPATFAKFNEEELRNVVLAHLNGHFQGKAAGEVFRRTGKTDIRIEEESRSAFVGECKVWGGAAQVSGDVDQLLGYLTWRDSKAAFIVFNKAVKGFTALRDSLIEAVKAHRCFVKEPPSGEAGEWRVVMRSLEDEGRLVTVQVFAFNIFAETKGEGPRIRQL